MGRINIFLIATDNFTRGSEDAAGEKHYSVARNSTFQGGLMRISSNLLTEIDVSARLHISVASLRRWRLEKRGPKFIKVGSLVRYRPEDLEQWLQEQPTGGTQGAKGPDRAVTGRESGSTALAS